MSEDQVPQSVLQVQHYQFQEAQANQYRAKEDLIKKYAQKKNLTFDENQKLLAEAKKFPIEKLSPIIVKGPEYGPLNLSITEEDKLSKIKIKMDQINLLNNIHFHRKILEVLYVGLLKPFLENKKLEPKVSKLEDQLKKKKTMRNGWKVQIKKLEIDMIVVGKNSHSKNLAKKLFKEKDKTISSLNKQLKIPITDHPQTEEFFTSHKQVDSLKQSVLYLEEKVLEMESDKQELQKGKEKLLMKSTPKDLEQVQKNSTNQLVEAMSQVILKDEEIKGLKGRHDKINLENESLKEEVSMLNLKLVGKSEL